MLSVLQRIRQWMPQFRVADDTEPVYVELAGRWATGKPAAYRDEVEPGVYAHRDADGRLVGVDFTVETTPAYRRWMVTQLWFDGE